jgi:hypothetical protein
MPQKDCQFRTNLHNNVHFKPQNSNWWEGIKYIVVYFQKVKANGSKNSEPIGME